MIVISHSVLNLLQRICVTLVFAHIPWISKLSYVVNHGFNSWNNAKKPYHSTKEV